MAGKPLLGGFKIAMVGVVGDWDWVTKALHLEQSFKRFRGGGALCHRCHATSLNFTDFRESAPHWVERSHSAYMSSPAAAASAVSRLPGFHILSVWPELMHGGPLGFNLSLGGTVLQELAEEHFWAPRATSGSWQDKLQVQLSAATDAFKRWQDTSGRKCTVPRFTVKRLSLMTLQRKPLLKSKAYNAIVIIEWLAAETKAMSDKWPANSYFQDRAASVWGLASVYQILRESPHWMTDDQLAQLKVARDAHCSCTESCQRCTRRQGHCYTRFDPRCTSSTGVSGSLLRLAKTRLILGHSKMKTI